MGDDPLTWEDCLPVVQSEARRYERMGAQIGLGHDDLCQEASIAALRCLSKWQAERGGRTAYVRQAVRNRFKEVRRNALRERRVPHDAHGRSRPLWLTSYEGLSEDNGPLPSIPVDYARFEVRMVLRTLEAHLPAEDWEFLVQTVVEGAHVARDVARSERRRLKARLARVQSDARRIITQVLQLQIEEVIPMAAPVPRPSPEELPECHAKGAQPQGYDREDGACWNCRDKFTCLPEALERGLIVGDIHDDREVEAVLAQEMTFRTAVNRMHTRLGIMERGGTVPAELQVSAPVETKVHRKPSAPPPPPEPEPEPTKPVKLAPKKAPRKARKIKAKPVLAPAPRVKPHDHSALVDKQGRPTMRNGKLLPPVRANTTKQMLQALERVKIGQPFALRVGMQLVRKTKEGEHVIVRIKPLGFEIDNVIYSSLSTAIMYRLRKMQSGNAYFHLEANQCTEIWSETGEVLAGHSSQ